MNNIIKDAIQEGWDDYYSNSSTVYLTEEPFEEGWKEGYEWILIELSIRGYISDEIVEHYMNVLCV